MSEKRTLTFNFEGLRADEEDSKLRDILEQKLISGVSRVLMNNDFSMKITTPRGDHYPASLRFIFEAADDACDMGYIDPAMFLATQSLQTLDESIHIEYDVKNSEPKVDEQFNIRRTLKGINFN